MKDLKDYYQKLTNEIQNFKKEKNFNAEEKIIAKIETKSDVLFEMFEKFGEDIKKEALIEKFDFSNDFQIKKEVELNGEKVIIYIKRAE